MYNGWIAIAFNLYRKEKKLGFEGKDIRTKIDLVFILLTQGEFHTPYTRSDFTPLTPLSRCQISRRFGLHTPYTRSSFTPLASNQASHPLTPLSRCQISRI